VAELRSLFGEGVGVTLVVRVRGRAAQNPQAAMKMLRRFVDVATEAGAKADEVTRSEASVSVVVSPPSP